MSNIPQLWPTPLLLHDRNNDTEEKVEVIGEVPGVEEESAEPVTLRPNRFRPKAGIREKLRTVLQETLEEISTTESSRSDDNDDR